MMNNELLDYYERVVKECFIECDGVCHLHNNGNCECVDANVLDHLRELQAYRAIGTVDECRVAVERMKEMISNDSIVTVGVYFEIHDADIYGGKGNVGYANTNVDLKVSALAKGDISNYVEQKKKVIAEMCKVDTEKVTVISRTDYEENTADEDDWDCEDDFD